MLELLQIIPPNKDWVDVLTGLLTPTIAVLGITIAWLQWRLGKLRFRFELSEKRYAKFEATRRFISVIVQEGRLNEPERLRFLTDTSGSRFLFGTDVGALLDELHKKGLQLHHAQVTAASAATPAEQRNAMLERETEIKVWFFDQLNAAEVIFGKYITVKTK